MSQENVVRRAWGAISSHGELPWVWDEDLRVENMPEWEVIELDDGRVLSIQRATGRAVHTRIAMDVLWGSVLTLRNGKIVRAQGYWTPEQAREAVGLSE